MEKNECKQAGIMTGGKWDKMHDIGRRYYNVAGISPTIHTMGGGNLEPKILEVAMRGRNPNNPSDRTTGAPTEQRIEVGGECANTITSVQNYRVRKLTPKECFRLMGFSDVDYQSCKDANVSDSQLYKQAGNSIVVNVLMAIFGQLYGVEWQSKVYGKWWKDEKERILDLPLFKGLPF